MTPEQRDVDAAEKLVEDWRLARPEHQWLGDRIVALVTAVRAEATREAIERAGAVADEQVAYDRRLALAIKHPGAARESALVAVLTGKEIANAIRALAAAPAAREEG